MLLWDRLYVETLSAYLQWYCAKTRMILQAIQHLTDASDPKYRKDLVGENSKETSVTRENILLMIAYGNI